MKNLLNNLLNWGLKKGSSETKKDQVSLRAIRYAAVLFMVLMVGVGQAWG